MNFLIRCLFIAVIIFSSAEATSETLPTCTEGEPKPPLAGLNGIRPVRTFICIYSFEEILSQIAELAANKASQYKVEAIEKVFSLPEMTTAFDAPRTADYSAILRGNDGWELLVNIEESFYPLNKLPWKFIPGLRPHRLVSSEDAYKRVTLTFITHPSSTSSSGRAENACIPVIPLSDNLVKEGWKDAANEMPPPTDGGQRTPLFANGNKKIAFDSIKRGCAGTIIFTQTPRN